MREIFIIEREGVEERREMAARKCAFLIFKTISLTHHL